MVKPALLVLGTLLVLQSTGQNLHGVWYSDSTHSCIEFDNSSHRLNCVMTLKISQEKRSLGLITK